MAVREIGESGGTVMENQRMTSRRMSRRDALRSGAGVLGLGLAAALAVPASVALAAAPRTTPALLGPVLQGDLNEKGWPTAYNPLTMGSIPSEDAIAQKSKYKPFTDFI